MDNETFKGMVLGVLQNADEDFARQALLALGHGYCSANAHPHSDQPFSADQRDNVAERYSQRAEQPGKEIERQRQRAEQAEHDLSWYRQRLNDYESAYNNAVDDLGAHKRRANAYAAWLAEHHNTLKNTADGVWTLLFEYGEEDRTDG